MNTEFRIKPGAFLGLKTLGLVFPKVVEKAQKVGAKQLLDWMNEGSPNETRTPPIRYGNLIGSSSAFVGSTLAGIANKPTGGRNSNTMVRPDPLLAYNGVKNHIYIVYNEEYATLMHEWLGGWGPHTLAKPDAGNKWVEKHLQADKDALMRVIGGVIKKELFS